MVSMTIIEILVDVAAHFEHGVLIRCDIGPTTVERSGNEYKNLRLIINTCNKLIGLQLNNGSY
jgi:hypothetical protein